MISPQTHADLQAFDVAGLGLDGVGRHALLLERDGIAVDEALRDALQTSGADVTVAPGPGYGAMTEEPGLSRAPMELFATVERWLAGAPTRARLDGRPSEREVKSTPVLELAPAMREGPFTVPQPFGDLFGILTEPTGGPAGDLCLVALNTGAVRRIGPNRMWVELTRRWAARGMPTLRIDLGGIGDSDGDAERYRDVAELYVPSLIDQVGDVIDALQARGTARRFVLVGMCSGAYWAFHAALADDSVAAALLLNPRHLFWDAHLHIRRDARKLARLGSRLTWRRIVRGEVSRERMAEVARASVTRALRATRAASGRLLSGARRSQDDDDEVDHAFDTLSQHDRTILLAFSNREPLLEELEREGRLARLARWPNVCLKRVPGYGHTLRPTALQRHAHRLLDDALSGRA